MGIGELLFISFCCIVLLRLMGKKDKPRDGMQAVTHALIMEQLRSNGLEAQLRACNVKLSEVLKQYDALLRQPSCVPPKLDELSMAVVNDALAREARAKAALRAVMVQQNVPAAAIDAVIDAIDSGPDNRPD